MASTSETCRTLWCCQHACIGADDARVPKAMKARVAASGAIEQEIDDAQAEGKVGWEPAQISRAHLIPLMRAHMQAVFEK